MRAMRILAAGAASVLLAACAAAPPAAAPAPAPATATTAGWLAPGEPDLLRYLAAPPAAGSPAGERDLAAVLAAQAGRDAAAIEAARLDQSVTVGRFADVLGPGFTAKRAPRTFDLATRACRQASQAVGLAKGHFQRPRPFRASDAVQPVVGNVTDGSYPSGHSACGYVWAILLADLVPAERDALFERGLRYGWNRVVGGVHYPSDVEAGRLSAALVVEALYGKPAFRADLEAARAEFAALPPS